MMGCDGGALDDRVVSFVFGRGLPFTLCFCCVRVVACLRVGGVRRDRLFQALFLVSGFVFLHVLLLPVVQPQKFCTSRPL